MRLSELDNDFLRIETRARPMHWAVLFDLDSSGEHISVVDLRERLRERVRQYPVLGLAFARGRWRRPKVTPAQHWDPATHLNYRLLPDEHATVDYVSTALATHLSGSAPRWSLTVIDQQRPTRQRLLLQVHHALADGISAAGYAALFVDEEAGGDNPLERFLTSPRYELPEIDQTLAAQASNAFRRSWWAGRTYPRWPALSRGGRRRIAYLSVPTAELRRSALHHGASVPEYLIVSVAVTLNRLPPPGRRQPRTIRTLVPVTLDSGFEHTGNAVSLAFLNISGTTTEPTAHLTDYRRQLRDIEHMRPELALPLAGRQTAFLPWPAQRAGSIATMTLLHPDIDIGVNPAFAGTKAVLGIPISRLYPFSALVYTSLAISTVVLGDMTTIGIVADPTALPGYLPAFADSLRDQISSPWP